MKTILQAPKGMPDILPEENLLRRKIFKVVEDLANFYGFGQIETPILEETKLFLHGTGPTSDIVQKQMFTLKTPGKDFLALRPEFTPNIVRAYLENGLYNNPKPVKLFAWGPVFAMNSLKEEEVVNFGNAILKLWGQLILFMML